MTLGTSRRAFSLALALVEQAEDAAVTRKTERGRLLAEDTQRSLLPWERWFEAQRW